MATQICQSLASVGRWLNCPMSYFWADQEGTPAELPEPEIENPRSTHRIDINDLEMGIYGVIDWDDQEHSPLLIGHPIRPHNNGVWPSEISFAQVLILLARQHSDADLSRVVLWDAENEKLLEIGFDQLQADLALAQILDLHDYVQENQQLDREPGSKCEHCQWGGICLPYENWSMTQSKAQEIPRLFAPRFDAAPLYIQDPGVYLGKSGECFKITKKGSLVKEIHAKDVSQLIICGNITLSSSAMHLAMDKAIPIVHMSMSHWFYGISHSPGLAHCFGRMAQFQFFQDQDKVLALCKEMIRAKGHNQRTLLRRLSRDPDKVNLQQMTRLLQDLQDAPTLDVLRGYEGKLAADYFGHFADMVKHQDQLFFQIEGRNRRPPLDPINAMLSYLYALLSKECLVALLAEGMDPHWGFFHVPVHGRPALALDLMEEFRPLIADSIALDLINHQQIQAADFTTNGKAWSLNASGRKKVITAYENRMALMTTHPFFGYRLEWRRVLFLQARLLAKYLRAEVEHYQGMVMQ